MTQDQANTLDGFRRVAEDYNKVKFRVCDDRQVLSNSLIERNRTMLQNGVVFNKVVSNKPVDGWFVLPVMGSDTSRWIVELSDNLNVQKHGGAKGDGATDDRAAIQRCVDYARTLTTLNGGPSRVNIIFPNATYFIGGNQGGIDITNANGIWLSGGQGKYLTTQITADCGGVIFDFSGSTMSGCNNFQFFTFYNVPGHNPPNIAVLFAYNGVGGLGCGISNCYFQLASNPTANNNFGVIGVCNIRAEEFYMSGCRIRANTAAIFSFDKSVVTRAGTLVVNSAFTTIPAGGGSMGVVDIGQGCSFENYDKTQHAVVLYGVNSLKCHAYIFGGAAWNPVTATANENSAYGIYSYCAGLNLSGTIEGFSTIIYLGVGARIYLSESKIMYANIQDITKPIIELSSNNLIDNCQLRVAMGNGSTEQGNRTFLYAPTVNSGNSPTTNQLVSSEFSCPEWVSNINFVSPNLLKYPNGIIRFNTGQPFTLENGTVTDNKRLPKSLGTVSAPSIVTVLGFLRADNTLTTSNNAGMYVGKIKGVVKIGGINSPNICTALIDCTLVWAQNGNTTVATGGATGTIVCKSNNSAAYCDLLTVTPSISYTGPYASLRLSVTASGTGASEPIVFEGQASIFTDFPVNGSVIFDF